VALMQARLDCQIKMGLMPAGTRLPAFSVNAESPNDGCPEETRMALHAAMVESIDRSLAKILEALEKSGERDNTLILVFSDNGASAQMVRSNIPAGVRPGSMDTFVFTGPALASLSNTPFRGYKLSDWQGGIAAPMIAWWPKGIHNKGDITDRITHIADIMPTCLELAGISYPSKFRGRTLIPLVGNSMVSTLHTGQAEAGNANRVIAWPRAQRIGGWKLVLENPQKPELYHISEDRNEQKDLADQYPERVKELQVTHASMVEHR
jgi:arylsulfatase